MYSFSLLSAISTITSAFTRWTRATSLFLLGYNLDTSKSEMDAVILERQPDGGAAAAGDANGAAAGQVQGAAQTGAAAVAAAPGAAGAGTSTQGVPYVPQPGQHATLPPVITPQVQFQQAVGAELHTQLPAYPNAEVTNLVNTLGRGLLAGLMEPLKQAVQAEVAPIRGAFDSLKRTVQQRDGGVDHLEQRLFSLVGVLREVGSKRLSHRMVESGLAGRFSEDGGSAPATAPATGNNSRGNSTSPASATPAAAATMEVDGGAGAQQPQAQQQPHVQQQPQAQQQPQVQQQPAGAAGATAAADGAVTTAGANAGPGPSGANPRSTQPPPAAAEPMDAEDPMSEALDASRVSFLEELADEYIGKHYPNFVNAPHQFRAPFKAFLVSILSYAYEARTRVGSNRAQTEDFTLIAALSLCSLPDG
eukprot:XP_001694187.1 predicted protein [Chlamydomonas reinhardtii]